MSFNVRIEKTKNKLSELGLSGMYITNLTNVKYLTGFTGSAGSVLVLEGNQHFFTDGRYIEQSKEQVKNCKIHIVGSTHYLAIQNQKLLNENAKIGFESDYVSMSLYDAITNVLPNIKFDVKYSTSCCGLYLNFNLSKNGIIFLRC